MTATAEATIFAVSSGRPPAAIAIIRISGPAAGTALRELAGPLPPARRATLRTLRDGADILDRAMVLWLPGPANATGEDLAELHVHGGRAVVAAVDAALRARAGLRPAEPGEFTRRALMNGRIDLAEAEGLADLLLAETDVQRRHAIALAGGAVSRDVARWRNRLLVLSARAEAELDFADDVEGDGDAGSLLCDTAALRRELDERLARPPVERLRDGVRVALAGPPNTGKSTLLNALVGRNAAIVSAEPGTTRDAIEAPTAIAGLPFLFIDTAGWREATNEVERTGVDLAHAVAAAADIVLWLDDEAPPPHLSSRAILIHPRNDLAGRERSPLDRIGLSALSGAGLPDLLDRLLVRARAVLPAEDEIALNQRQRVIIDEVARALGRAAALSDIILIAEELRVGRSALDRLLGTAGVEDMLDHLFAGLCIGK